MELKMLLPLPRPSAPFIHSSRYPLLENCMLASSAVVRRQQFLIRALGCSSLDRPERRGMARAGAGIVQAMEVDSESVVRGITPLLESSRYKGQAGKIAVIGGCREYTGAPYFAAISALKIGISICCTVAVNSTPILPCIYNKLSRGADLSHVFCTKDAAPVIKSYSPELIVHPVLEESYSIRDNEKDIACARVVSEVMKWMERFDCLVIGPGLGRDPFLLDCVTEIMSRARKAEKPLVIDGDGLFLITSNIEIVSGYPFAVLTPNINEYKRLVERVLSCEVDVTNASEQLLLLSKRIGGVTILRKGKEDLISDGKTVNIVSIFGSPRRCGGQGDILSGSVAVFTSWAAAKNGVAEDNLLKSVSNPMVLGCISGSAIVRKAASLAFKNNKRATLTTDIIACLGESLEEICPSDPASILNGLRFST